MFWRERERETKEQNGGPPCGQVRVLVVGDSGIELNANVFSFQLLILLFLFIFLVMYPVELGF